MEPASIAAAARNTSRLRKAETRASDAPAIAAENDDPRGIDRVGRLHLADQLLDIIGLVGLPAAPDAAALGATNTRSAASQSGFHCAKSALHPAAADPCSQTTTPCGTAGS